MVEIWMIEDMELIFDWPFLHFQPISQPNINIEEWLKTWICTHWDVRVGDSQVNVEFYWHHFQLLDHTESVGPFSVIVHVGQFIICSSDIFAILLLLCKHAITHHVCVYGKLYKRLWELSQPHSWTFFSISTLLVKAYWS